MITDTAPAASRSEVGLSPGPERGRRNVIELPAQAPYVASARRFARCLLRQWGADPETVDSAVLVVSELAGNAVRHGHGYMEVEIAAGKEHFSATVTSRTARCTVQNGTAPDACENGRGLEIIAALADRLSVETTDTSWRVTAELDRHA